MTNSKRVIEFFLYPDAIALDITGALDVFSFTTELFKSQGISDQGYELVFSGIKQGEVRLNSGLGLVADFAIGSSKAPDILVLPGGMSTVELLDNTDLINKLTAHALTAKQVVTICRGVYLAAACGLLEHKVATMHWMDAEHFSKIFPAIQLDVDAIYNKDDEHVWTSAGITSGIDLALAIVEEHFGSQMAMEVARILVLYRYRPGNQSQFSTTMQLQSKVGERFTKLHNWIQENLASKLTVDDMAAFMAMSPRNFSRAFTKEMNVTPAQYIELMRINHARELLESSDASLSVIAHASGFVREEKLRRAFVRRFGVTPSQYRIHFGSAQ